MRFVLICLAVLSLGLSPYAAMAFSHQAGGSHGKGIQSITMDTVLLFEGGFQVEVTLQGEPGGQAAVRINRGHKLYAREVAPGIYKAHCLRSIGSRMTNIPVTGFLVPQQGPMVTRSFDVTEAVQVAMFQSGMDPRIQVSASQTGEDDDATTVAPDETRAEVTEAAPVVHNAAPVAKSPVQVPEASPSAVASAPAPAATFTPNLTPGPGVLNNDTIDEMRRYYNDPADPVPAAPAPTTASVAPVAAPVSGEVCRDSHDHPSGTKMPSGIVIGERHEFVATPTPEDPNAVPTVPAGWDSFATPTPPPATSQPPAVNNSLPPVVVQPPPIVAPHK